MSPHGKCTGPRRSNVAFEEGSYDDIASSGRLARDTVSGNDICFQKDVHDNDLIKSARMNAACLFAGAHFCLISVLL